MVVKKKMLATILLSALVLASTAVTQAAANECPPLGPGPDMMIQRMADDWGVNKDELSKYMRQGVNPHDLDQAATLAKLSGKSLPDILTMKNLANTWKEVEDLLGVSPEQIHTWHLNRLAAKLAGNLSVSQDRILALVKQGYQPPDISLAAMLAQNIDQQKSIEEVLSLKKINNEWPEVAKSLGVSDEIFRQDQEKLRCFAPGPHGPGPQGHPGMGGPRPAPIGE